MQTFTEKAFLLCMDYLISEAEEIILLRENHTSAKYLEKLSRKKKVTVCYGIEDCIDRCDCALIMQSDILPQRTVRCVEQLCINRSKQCYTVKCAGRENNLTDDHAASLVRKMATDTQVILIVPIGDMALPEYIEVLVNKILSENGISFRQHFLPNTASVIEQLKESRLSDVEYREVKETSLRDFDVLAVTVPIESMEACAKDSLMQITDLYPDYIILVTDGNDSEVPKYRNYFQYVCNKKVDMVIHSPYAMVYQDCLIEVDNNIVSENGVSMLDEELENRITEEVFVKMALPDGVHLIQ